MICVRLFVSFFRVGLLAIGGGLATPPLLQELAEKTGWFTNTDIANMLAVSEVTPGAVGINMATYAGFLTAGVEGAVWATLGLVTPQILIILLIFRVIQQFREHSLFQNVLKAIRPVSVALICAAGLDIVQDTLLKQLDIQDIPNWVNWKNLVIALFLAYLWKKRGVHYIICLATAAVLGAVLPEF